MAEHHLKTWTEPFALVWIGQKTFEIRIDDEHFEVGDILYLEEWDSEEQRFTGRAVQVQISAMVHGPEWGLPNDLCVMGWRDRLCVQGDPG